MPWVTPPTVKSLGKYMVRMTGAVLGGASSATFGLSGDAGVDTQLPASFPTDPGAPGLNMSDVVVTMAAESAAPGGAGAHLHITQQDNPFRVTCTNDGGGGANLTLELFVQFLHSLIR